MSENEEKKLEKSADDIIAELDKKFQSRLVDQESKISEKISSLKEKVKAESESEKDSDWSDESGDEDDFITKKDLKKLASALLNESEKKTEKIVETKLGQHSTKLSRDHEAFKLFPMLNAESSHYNSEFKNAVKKEMDERIERGRSVDDPDLIFDCAAIVKATNPRFAQSLEEQANNEVRRKNNGESGFTVRKVGTETVGTPNARQLELAKKWNMPEDFLKQHMKSKSG